MNDETAPQRPLSLHRQAAAAQGGRAARHRQGPLHRRFQSRRAGLCRDGALAPSACAHRRDRCRGGKSHARRARRLHRRRLRRRRSCADSARSGAQDQIRHEAHRARRRRGVHRPACAVAGGQGAPCRRGGRDGRRRDQSAGAGCRRGGRRALRGIAVRAAFRGRDGAGRAGGVGRGAQQHLRRYVFRRCRRRPIRPLPAPRMS